MANNTRKAPIRNPRSERETPAPAVPAGYKKRTNEVKGFWDPKSGSPVHFVPRSARAFDNKTDPIKSSILIQGESIGVNSLITKDGETTESANGDVIGVWYKPGMAAIKELRNVAVYMYANGERDTGKPQPMQLFEVLSPKTGDTLYINDDYRQKSQHTNLPLEIKAGAQPSDDVDVPF